MGEIITRRGAHARGVTDSEIKRLVRNGTWTRLATGVYVPSTVYESGDDRARHAFRACALSANASGAALSHISAAVLHGVDVWEIPLDDVHLTRNASSGSRRVRGRVMHAAPFAESEVVDLPAGRVLSVARTVVDVAASVPFEQAVVVGDSALRRGLTVDCLHRAVALRGSHPGGARVRRAVRFMSARSDSVGESRSRVLFVREQLPIPMEQVDVFDAYDRWLARVDFLWDEFGVIGEFDGRIKYRRDGVASMDAEEVVYREKLREDALRRAGWTVVRWTWRDLNTPGVVASMVGDAVTLAARGGRPVGRFATNS